MNLQLPFQFKVSIYNLFGIIRLGGEGTLHTYTSYVLS